MQHAAFEQRLHDLRNAADIVDVLGDVFAARLQVGDVRRALEDFGDVEQIEVDADFVGHGRQMQGAVGRAAGGRNDVRRVFKGFARADIARTDAVGEQPHDRAAAVDREQRRGFHRVRARQQSPATPGRWLRKRTPSCWR